MLRTRHAVPLIYILAFIIAWPAFAGNPPTFDEEGNAPVGPPQHESLTTAKSLAAPMPKLKSSRGPADWIGLDGVHNESLADSIQFSQLRAEITSHGLNINPMVRFEAADIAGLKAIIVKHTSFGSYTDQEIADIHTFVAGGGGLILLAEVYNDSGTIDRLNLILQPYGIALSYGAATESEGYTITGFLDHPVTRGLQSIGVDAQRCLASILPPAIDLTLNDGPDQALACWEGSGGAGNVVVLSDCSLFKNTDSLSQRNIAFGDNTLLLHNILTFVTGVRQVPVELSRFRAD